MKNQTVDKKSAAILIAALIIPGGFIALGVWKFFELYKKNMKKPSQGESDLKRGEHV